MKLKSDVTISSSPSSIWPHVADPELMMRWNPKLRDIERFASGPVATGDTYVASFAMGSEPKQTHVEVLQADAPCRLVLQFVHNARPRTQKSQGAGPRKTIREVTERAQTIVVSYELEDLDDKTRVRQSVDLSQSVPMPLQWLIWGISKRGSSPDKTYLTRLKEAVEEGKAYPGYSHAEAPEEFTYESAAVPKSTAGGEPLTKLQRVKVTRDDSEILEIRDNSARAMALFGVIFAVIGLVVCADLLADWAGDWQALLLQGGIPLAVGFLCLAVSTCSTIFRFDKNRRIFTWKRKGLYFQGGGRQCEFDEIKDLRVKSGSAGTTRGYCVELAINERWVEIASIGDLGGDEAHCEIVSLAERLRDLLGIRPG